MNPAYCPDRFATRRRRSTAVQIGSVPLGGHHPVRLQSMTTSDTQDVPATIRQAVALAEVGCEIVRVTAPNVSAARCLRDIRRGLDDAGWRSVPLVADIHFLPQAAMEAVEHVEKVRVNPGNYADRKRFASREYTDAEYAEELDRLHAAFSPLVLRARALGRTLRIGTNHGSLSDRIMNRYGDTPLGMVESALEFVRICEDHGFHDIVLSMKASNPKVMIQAYRLLVARMDAAHRPYPLHLGVTEAGDGEDGRIKSAVGIGSLLLDGLGDTIRVSLTEDSVYEIPVARALATRAQARWSLPLSDPPAPDAIDACRFTRRSPNRVELAPTLPIDGDHPPRVLLPLHDALANPGSVRPALSELRQRFPDLPVEGLIVRASAPGDLAALPAVASAVRGLACAIFLELPPADLAASALSALPASLPVPLVLVHRPSPSDLAGLESLIIGARSRRWCVAIDAPPSLLAAVLPALRSTGPASLIATCSQPDPTRPSDHPSGLLRAITDLLARAHLELPVWIRCTPALALPTGDTAPGPGESAFLHQLLDASILAGTLLADGIGDALSIETTAGPELALPLTYNVLQGAGARISKTEFVACPSCGRTLFDLQTTTQRIRSATGHLKGLKIAVMGCIVNGPGEMADADFGYVGGAPGKVNLYVGRTPVKYNVPESEAVDRLVDLIRDHGKWVDAPASSRQPDARTAGPVGAAP